MIFCSRQKLVQVAAAVTLLALVCWITRKFGNGLHTRTDITSIPKILHQTWDTENVPSTFSSWIWSWVRLHPRWEYYFWTEADVRLLLVQHYPDYVSMYDGYKGSIFRSDAMRYFVLYHYGGVYADLDVEALQPMDTLIAQYKCVLSYETYEHALFLYKNPVPVVMTTIMATRPHHPFFRMLVDTLKENAFRPNVMDATGPFFLNSVYLRYSKEPVRDPVTVLPSNYLLPTFDRGQTLAIKTACHLPQTGEAKRLCDWHEETKWRNNPGPESYTNHHWFHVVFKDDAWKQTNTFHIDSLVPNRTRPYGVTYKPTNRQTTTVPQVGNSQR